MPFLDKITAAGIDFVPNQKQGASSVFFLFANIGIWILNLSAAGKRPRPIIDPELNFFSDKVFILLGK